MKKAILASALSFLFVSSAMATPTANPAVIGALFQQWGNQISHVSQITIKNSYRCLNCHDIEVVGAGPGSGGYIVTMKFRSSHDIMTNQILVEVNTTDSGRMGILR